MTNASCKYILIAAFLLLVAVASYSQDRVPTVAFFRSDPTGAKKEFLGYFADQANSDLTNKGYIFLLFRDKKGAVKELCWVRSHLRTLKTKNLESRLSYFIETSGPRDEGVEKELVELYLDPPDVEPSGGALPLKELVCKR